MKEFSHPGTREKAPADLNRAIESTVTVTRNEWKYVAELKLELDPELPAVACLVGEFNQCIVNLVVNASHAIGDVIKGKPGTKGTITIRTRRDGEFAEVRVSDTGTGIPEAIRPRIFEPFFTTKGLGQGTGQGLAIIYASMVRRHGGTVSFETEVGKGTTFILRLPLVPPTTPLPANAAQPS
jgi:signal transduction histidine kinase